VRYGISAVVTSAPFVVMGGCDDNDDVWSGGSGWLIGLLVGILLLVLILGARKKMKK
jgi:hypothetical protein